MGTTFSSETAPQTASGGSDGADASADTLPSALVICGPSGVGKGTLIKKLMAGSDRYGFSCSHTTRAPREGEQVRPPCPLFIGLSKRRLACMAPALSMLPS